jgi:hypothetical protein
MELVQESQLVKRATERWLRNSAKHSLKQETSAERVYIAGKVGDLTDDDYYKSVVAKISERERQMKALGYVVVNPMRIVKRGTDWQTAMRICITALCGCGYITTLPDIYDSQGGMMELGIANKIGIKMVFPSRMNGGF